MNKAIVLALVIGISVSSAVEARTYHRSCNAVFRILPLEPGLDLVRDTVQVEPFYAQASAGGYIPNTIRLRAYRRARDCINSAWADPLSHSIPAECTNSGGNGIYDYSPHPSLLGEMANRACHAWGPGYRGRYVMVRIVGYISGDNGCGGSRSSDDIIIPLAGGVDEDPYPLYVPMRCDT